MIVTVFGLSGLLPSPPGDVGADSPGAPDRFGRVRGQTPDVAGSDEGFVADEAALLEERRQCRLADLLEPVRDAESGLVEVDDPAEIDRRPDQDEVGVGA